MVIESKVRSSTEMMKCSVVLISEMVGALDYDVKVGYFI